MNLVLIHKAFKQRARDITNERTRKFERDQKLAQKKFEFLNATSEQHAHNLRMQEAFKRAAESFAKLADAIKQQRNKVRFEEGGKRAGKTQRAEQFKKWYGFKDIHGDILDDGVFKKSKQFDEQQVFDAFGVGYEVWKTKHRDEWVQSQREEWMKIFHECTQIPNFERMYGEKFTEPQLKEMYNHFKHGL